MANDAGTIYSEIRIMIDKLKGDVNQVVSTYKQMGKELGVESTKTKDTATKNFKDINLAGVAAFAGIGMAIKAAVSTFANFEQSMANVASVSGATADEFKSLRDAAMAAGEGTRFTASQAADALYFLSSAGFDATQSVSALNGVLQLAGATGSDLSQTAETMTATLAQFGLQAEESGRVSNVFAAAISNSQATLSKLQTAFRQVGPIAGTFGISIEESTASLQALFNAGFQGEQAGTALRSILLDLSNETGVVAQKLIEAGLAFDSFNPQAVGLTEAIEVLTASGADMTQIFGKESIAALLSLQATSQETTGNLRDLEAAVTDTTKAADMYAQQNDTLAGSMDVLKSQVESAMIKTMEQLSGVFRGLVDFAALLVSGFNALPGPIKGAVGIFAVLLGGLVGLSVVIPLVTGLLTGLTITIGALTLTAGPIMLLFAGVAALASGVISLVGAFNKADTKKIAKDYQKLGEEFGLTEKQLVKLVKAARSAGIMAEDFARLQKESGLATNELKKFIKVGEQVGISADEVVKLNTEYGLTAKQIKRTGGELDKLQELMTLGYYEAGEGIEIISSNLKISKEQTAAIVLAQKGVSTELKNQAKLILSNAKSQKDAVAELVMREAYLASLKAGNTWAKQKADAEAAAQRLKDAEKEAKIAQQIADLADVEIKKNKELQIIKTSLEKGLITEEEAGKARIKVYEDVAKQVLDINNGYDAGNWQLAEALKYLKEQNVELDHVVESVDDWKTKLEELDQTALQAIEAQRDLALEGVEAGSELEAAINEYYDRLASDEANKEFLDNLKTTTDEVKSIFDSLSDAVAGIFETMNKIAIEDVEKRLQAELEANGLAEKSAVEKAQESLDAAIKAGDEIAINDAKNALQKAQIEEKYAREKAKIEYDGAMAAWNLRWLGAIGDTAAAVIKLLANPPAAIAAGIAGAVQTGIIVANKPTMPAFETGGIVPGKSFKGDNVLIRANSGEGVFTKEQMEALGGGAGQTNIDVYVTMGKYAIDDVVVDVVERRSDAGTMRINKAAVI